MVEEVAARGNILGKCIPARYIFAILGNIGMAIIYGLKVNLSVAMVAMLNHTAIKADDTSNNTTPAGTEECVSPSGPESLDDGEFNWSSNVQGILLSCYFWGYFISQIPGAYIAENFSAKWVMFASVTINVVCTILTPVLTKLHYVGMIVMRVLEGIGGGATFPAMHCMIAAWSPPNERSVISTIIYVGTSLGTAISILMSGVIAAQFGWVWVFYIMGGLSSLWIILWMFLIADNPNKQRFISNEEREMIVSQLKSESGSNSKNEKHPAVPWRSVLKSVPFWSILIAHCASNWGWYMFLIEIPFYLKQVLKLSVSRNAIFSALPFFPLFIFSMLLGKTLDILRSKQIINTTWARKIATSCCSIVPALCLLALCFVGCDQMAAIAIMSVGIVFMGAMFPGYLSNHIDIAPNFAGTLVAMTNTVATIPGIVVPVFVGFITTGNQTIDAWSTIFYVTIGFFAIEFIVFTAFASGEVQPWNNTDKDTADQNEIKPLKPKEKP